MQRYILAALQKPSLSSVDVKYSLDELAKLLETLDAEAVCYVVQKGRPNPATYIGRGKAYEIAELARKYKADGVVFDDPISPAQQRNLENITQIKVLDRFRVIFEVFASRARDKESKVQIELAEIEYMLPRLTGKGRIYSQQFGRIGTRGPGEMELEYERRALLRRMKKLKDELKSIEMEREVQNKLKKESFVPQVSLVGYTNAGKSTLLNAVAKSNVYVDDLLFSTLSSTTRKVFTKDGRFFLLTDTIGFISKIPPSLITTFKSTLLELSYSDLILHVIDISNPQYPRQIEVVEKTLKELGINKKVLNVYNKIDVAGDIDAIDSSGIFISAKKFLNIDKLVERILEELYNYEVKVKTSPGIFEFIEKYRPLVDYKLSNGYAYIKTTPKLAGLI